MKDKWRYYATQNRVKQKGYFRKHSYRGKGRQAGEASGCDCLQQSREEPKEEEVENESIREKEVNQAPEQGRQRVPLPDQGRSEIKEIIKSNERQKMKKQSMKEKKHEAKETKAFEKKEDKKVPTAGKMKKK